MTFGELRPEGEFAMESPMPESSADCTAAANIPGQEAVYGCSLRGSTVAGVSAHYRSRSAIALYERDHIRAATAPAKQATRFVAGRPILRW